VSFFILQAVLGNPNLDFNPNGGKSVLPSIDDLTVMCCFSQYSAVRSPCYWSVGTAHLLMLQCACCITAQVS